MTTSELVKINKDFFIRSANLASKTAIFTAFPYLNIPPLNYLINQAIEWLVGKIADGLELSVFFIYVDFRVDEQGNSYTKASQEAYKNPTEENKKRADEAFDNFFKLNRY